MSIISRFQPNNGLKTKRGLPIALACASLMAVSVAAWSADQTQDTSQHHSHDMSQMSEGSKKMHEAMMMGMQDMKMTGDADRDFAEMMIHHHQQAIAMARAQLSSGKSTELRNRAQKIIDDSQKDIDALQKWQKSSGAKETAQNTQ